MIFPGAIRRDRINCPRNIWKVGQLYISNQRTSIRNDDTTTKRAQPSLLILITIYTWSLTFSSCFSSRSTLTLTFTFTFILLAFYLLSSSAFYPIQTWLCLSLAMAIIGPLFYGVHYLSPYHEHHQIKKKGGLFTIQNCFWYMYGALLQQGKCHHFSDKLSINVDLCIRSWRWNVFTEIGQWTNHGGDMVASGTCRCHHILWKFGGIFNLSKNGKSGEHSQSVGQSRAWIHLEYSNKHFFRRFSQSESSKQKQKYRLLIVII